MKYNIKLNVGKLENTKKETRTYKNKNGEDVSITEMKLDVVILGDQMHKRLATSNNKELVKIGFVAEPSTKGEDGQWINGQTVGDITIWREIQETSQGTINDEVNEFMKYLTEQGKKEAEQFKDIPF